MDLKVDQLELSNLIERINMEKEEGKEAGKEGRKDDREGGCRREKEKKS